MRQLNRNSVACGQRVVLAVVAAAFVLIGGARLAFADCCTCTTPFDGGTFCGPTQFVPCDLSNDNVMCPGSTIQGTCQGGDQPDGSGTGGTCVPAGTTQAPLLSPRSPAFLLAALAAATALLVRRFARR